MFSRHGKFGLFVGVGLGLAAVLVAVVFAQSDRSIEVRLSVDRVLFVCSDDSKLAVDPVTTQDVVLTCTESSDPAAHVPPPDTRGGFTRILVSPGEDALVRCPTSGRVLAYDVHGDSVFMECLRVQSKVRLPVVVNQKVNAPAPVQIE